MSVMLTKKTVVLAKVESTYGTDPTPDAANNAIEAYEAQIKVSPETKERNPGMDTLGQLAEMRGKTFVEVTFKTLLRGSGSAGTASRQSPLFKACGASETIVSSTSVTYAPVSSSFDSCTIYVYLDGILHVVVGCVGDVEIDYTAGENAICSWTFKGIYALPTDQAIVSPTFDTTAPEIVKGCTMTLGNYSAIINKLTLKFGNVVAARPDFNQTEGYKGFAITDMKPEGSVEIEAILRATSNADFWSYFHSKTVKALSMVLGSSAGNINTLTASYCYCRVPEWGDREGARIMTIPFQCAKSSGNDMFSLAQT